MKLSMNIIHLSNGKTLRPHSPTEDLLAALGRHLSHSLYLNDAEIFAIKSWLLTQAQDFEPGHFLTLEVVEQGETGLKPDNVLAAAGKDAHGEAVVWHRPLPLPPGAAPLFH